MDQPKISRILRLMKMLTANTSYTVADLAERLAMSRRTIYRYIDTFREVGFVIKKDGDYIRLDRESPHFKDISQLVHFTEEEAVILKKSIEAIDDNNLLKSNLKRKLYSIYDNKVLANTVVSGKNAPNVHNLVEAIESHKVVILREYQSAHGSVIRDRRVEPITFTTNYVQVWCYDTEDNQNKLFKTSRIGAVDILNDDWAYESEHQEGFMDLFRMTGNNRYRVRLQLGMLSCNLLREEYPLSSNYLTEVDGGVHLLDIEVANVVGVGRFVMGLLDDIKIIDSPELSEYINSQIEKYAKK